MQLQVDGTHMGRKFTIVYVVVVISSLLATSAQRATVIIVHLRSTYPETVVEARSVMSRRKSATTGHLAFDEKFRVKTKAAGGPAALISPRLAEAHVAKEIPLWRLRDEELVCHTDRRMSVEELDIAIEQAIRVAELLGVT